MHSAPSSAPAITPLERRTQYDELLLQARALFTDEHDAIANAANLSALVFETLPGLNWAGFYFLKNKELVLGPFQGRPACVRIQLDRGVCGAAASSRILQVVPDVHAFPGHIACDPASRSEIVVPLITRSGELLGVWDVDSPHAGRFDDIDAAGMQALCQAWLDSLRPQH